MLALGCTMLASNDFAFLMTRKMCAISVVCDNIHVTYLLSQQHFHLFSVEFTKISEQIYIN